MLALRAEIAPITDASDPLPRLVASLESEPLAMIAFRDVRGLAAKYDATTLAKMIADPSYEEGAASLERGITRALGFNLRQILAAIERSINGPVALALVPGQGEGAPMRLVLLVQVPTPEVGEALKQQFPKDRPAGSVLATAEVRGVPEAELTPRAKMPAWAAKANWPSGDLIVWAQPLKLCATARPLVAQGKSAIAGFAGEWSSLFSLIEGSGIDSLAWGVQLKDELIGEWLRVNLADEDSAFRRFVAGLREKPSAWDALMAATAGDADGSVLFQCDMNALGGEQAHLFQALERYLRGKRWTKLTGGSPEALDPARFKFLSNHMQGSFSLTARAAITGEMRLTVTSAITGGEAEEFRNELVNGLLKIDAPFETLKGARKIGGASPLGATFHGRGQFASPVIGLSNGWAWLCSSSIAYQELTDAFKSGKTMAAFHKRRPGASAQSAIGANGGEGEGTSSHDGWGSDEALRVDVNLDRVLKLGYAAWLLSAGNEAPVIAGQKISRELVPSPQVFQRNVGRLRASAGRAGSQLEYRSSCVIPGITLALMVWMQDASETVADVRKPMADGSERIRTDGSRPVPKSQPDELK